MAKAESTPLTEAQREIMEVVWDREEVTVTQVRDVLAKKREVARNTIQTMIVRLEERGWLKHREEGRTFWYSANRPRTASLGARVAQMVDRLFAGSPEDMVTALMEYRGLSSDEADRIREMIESSETEADSRTAKKKASKTAAKKKGGRS
ncbi:MAG: BlaI/MecI/CopY family transcriptional regulator [Planctomycetota bacterium]